MQRSGTEAIITQIQPSKPKREITKLTNSQNTKRTYGQPSEQLFPKRWPLNNPNGTKNKLNTRMVKPVLSEITILFNTNARLPYNLSLEYLII